MASLSKGALKLLRREATLREWVEDGRDNYELARAFHVPIGDVRTVIAMLGLTRPEQYQAPAEAPRRARRCCACGQTFQATRYRFRCDECLAAHAALPEGGALSGWVCRAL
ncbi:hypothetical protein [Acidocella sp. KAb 2-4]|uniref:hypothetical protein n=1 Tax=Acidocella sp. KAb 2-4 TaxID=2885158 RepID=UPI001D0623AC|nr:hypothetical protein [Acidocella sp. KAb 2-4]MCB5945935.1 hypothetical protein [Acidocella sp. KAb 2-4]